MQAIIDAVEKNRELMLKAQDYIWKNPETGYREVKTSKFMEEQFEALGYDLVRAGDIPGFYTVIDTGRPGPEILILGELDSLICVEHPNADPKTGAVHCCGRSAQSAASLGIAAALKDPKVLEPLCGRIRLCSVPAEELIEIEYRNELRAKGIIKYYGGKPEFLRRGYFDGVDIAFMVHTSPNPTFTCGLGSVGCIAKKVTYKGVSAHAGGSPCNGCNALYGATLGIQAINSIRETFQEKDIIRVHPIITKGGSAVNAIPDTVTIESYIRGESFEAILEANKKVNRALCGGALSLGANIDIQDQPGYAPYRNCPDMIDVAEEALGQILPEEEFKRIGKIGSGSTDMGDLACIMPMIHPHAPGAVGRSHGANYYIEDGERAIVGSAKWQLAMLTLLLKDGGKRAKAIKEAYEPKFKSKEEYLAYLDSMADGGDRITYQENGDANIRLS